MLYFHGKGKEAFSMQSVSTLRIKGSINVLILELLEDEGVYREKFLTYSEAAKYIKFIEQLHISPKDLVRMLETSAKTGGSLLKKWYVVEIE